MEEYLLKELLSSMKGYLGRIWDAVRNKKTIPKETLRIVSHPRQLIWNFGSVGGKKAMQLHGSWAITNITDQPVVVVKGILNHSTEEAYPLLSVDRQSIGDTIPPGVTVDLSLGFFVEPPVVEAGTNFISTVKVIDNFNNIHKIKNVLFKSV